jgi:glycosyltransferase involved in cell wall biosynthesis
MLISLITACRNCAATIKTAMQSVLDQKGADIEYIVVDGNSTDGTVDAIRAFEQTLNSQLPHSPTLNFSFKWISEPDRGMYDAINKGIAMATGDVVGILNADDVLASDDTLAKIVAMFEGEGKREEGKGKRDEERGCIEAVYADIRFVKEGETVEALRAANTVRYCSAARWRPWMFRFGAMVPHPSFYVRRECFERLGGYSLDYRICADFELELRYLYLAKLKAAYLPECVVVMRMGGMSTAGWRSNVAINTEDLRALRSHKIWSCLPLIYLKYLFKIWGFVFCKRLKG